MSGTTETLRELREGICAALPAAQRLARHQDPAMASLGRRMDDELHRLWAEAHHAYEAARAAEER